MAKLISADLTNNKLCILEYTTTDGQMLSFKKDAFDAKIVSHTYTNIGKVIFDKPITKIGDSAFAFCDSLTSVTIPDSVTTIGKSAFWGCDSIASVTIGNGVTTIGGGAFNDCSNLTSVYINDIAAWCNISFSSAESNPLYNTGNLYLNNELVTDLTIPDSVTTIGNYAFYECSSLTSVTIPDSITIIGNSAFRGCSSLKEFNGKFAADGGSCLIVYGVLNAFAIGCGVTQYTIPDSVTSIGNDAFFGCDSLTSVTIPDSVTTIGDYAFFRCDSLTSVTIPDSVTTIGEWAFRGCRSLTCVTIPDSVTTIGVYAFSWCESLTSVTIPDSVTTIGKGVFAACSSLTSVTIPDSVTTIGVYAFRDCNSLTSVIIGSSVNVIGRGAFRYNNLDIVVCCPKIPPKIDNSFGKFENLIVPKGCEEAYANSDWGEYLE